MNSNAKTGDYQLALQLSRENVTNNKQPDSNIEQAKKASLLELKSAPTSVSHQQSLNYSTAKIAPARKVLDSAHEGFVEVQSICPSIRSFRRISFVGTVENPMC